MSTEEQRQNSDKRPDNVKPHQFKPGQSGNPGGRPKGRSVSARLRERLQTEIKGNRQLADLVTDIIIARVLKGDHKFLETLLNRTEGKVREAEPDNASLTDQELIEAAKKFIV